MYTITPINEQMLGILGTAQSTAPTAYRSAGYNNSLLTPTISGYEPSERFKWISEQLGYRTARENPDSTTTKAVNEAKGVAKSFGELGFKDKADTVLGGIQSIYGLYNAHQQMKMAKDQLAFNKMVNERNYQAQRKMANSQLEDRQKRRVEEAQANGRTTTSVGDYMAKYGV